MESFWGALKAELVHYRRFSTREQAQREITEYIGSSISVFVFVSRPVSAIFLLPLSTEIFH